MNAIDSHPVTKEDFGYRVTAYFLKRFVYLNPNEIWFLYADPEVAIDRITNQPSGQPQTTVEEARFHTSLQSSIAITCGMSLGISIYMFNSRRSLDQVANNLAARS